MRTFALLASLCLWATLSGAAHAEDRPNILFAFADDWGRYASAYGQLKPGGINDLVATPNFDRVAKSGVLFTHAFVNAPSCTPCRSALVSGQYFWRTGRGAILHNAQWDPKIPVFPLMLRDSGYHIGYSFKVWGPGTPSNAPYGQKAYAFEEPGTNRWNSFSEFVSQQPDIAAAKQTLYDGVRTNFQKFLAARTDDKPFCYWWGPTNVHRKWVQGSGKKLWNLEPDQLEGKLPKFLPDVPIVREDVADYLGEVQAFDAGLGVLLDELEKTGELDNTLIVISGDHGMPGVPRGKCNLYDFGVGVSLAMAWPKKVPAGRVVDDFVCLPDLCPTFLEAGGVAVPDVMTGRSLMNVLTSSKSGQVDPTRDYAVAGRERHVSTVREGNFPYPQRAIHTKDFVYIRNFKPERWPLGEGPGYGRPEAEMPYADLQEETYTAFGDMDASPTKAWLVTHRNDPGMEVYFNFAFARRPGEELYDLRSDPDCLKNVAEESAYRDTRDQLSQRLMTVLTETRDPRVTGDGDTFDKPPFTDVPANVRRRGAGE
jgi:N-sulfoglucosamine sulfohydrolase